MLNSDGLLSLLLASIELVFILNLLYHTEKSKTNVLFLLLLTLLFSYQLVEFIICGLGFDSSLWAYFALVTITFMPPLSLYVVLEFCDKNKFYNYLIFIPAFFFVLYYPFVIEEFAVTKCTVIYASYNYPLGFLYGVFYYLPIATVIILLGFKKYSPSSQKKNKLTNILFWGFTVTFIPGFLFTRLVPGMLEAVESILCSFAFILFMFISYFLLAGKGKT